MRFIQGDLASQSAELRNGVVRMSCKARSTSGSGGTGVLEPGAGGSATSAAGFLGRNSGRGKLWARMC